MSNNLSNLQCAYCEEVFPAGAGHECDYKKLQEQSKQYREALEDIRDHCFDETAARIAERALEETK